MSKQTRQQTRQLASQQLSQGTEPEHQNLKQKRDRISYSELKIWNECPYKHKLAYIDNVRKFVGNEYTAFGTAIHHVCENLVINKDLNNPHELFELKFLEELKAISGKYEFKKDLVTDMRKQGKDLIQYILPALDNYFQEYKVVSVEEPLYEDMSFLDTEKNFKGFVDLILETPDGKYHIIDWKTCSWGWDMKRKNEKITTYQLTLYKKFYSLKYNIDMSKIETHFALLKRTAKNNNVEIFKVSSGERKTNNALDLLKRAIYNIDHGLKIKNRSSCRNCEFYKTEHCR